MTTVSNWHRPGAAVLALVLLLAACGADGEALRTITTDAEGNVTSDTRDGDDPAVAETDADAGSTDGTDDADAAAGSNGDQAGVDGDAGGQVAVDDVLLIAETVSCTSSGPADGGEIELVTAEGTLEVFLAGVSEDSYVVRWTPGVFGVDTMRSFALDFNDDRAALAAGVQAFDIEVGTSGSLTLPASTDEAIAEQPDGVEVQWNGRCAT